MSETTNKLGRVQAEILLEVLRYYQEDERDERGYGSTSGKYGMPWSQYYAPKGSGASPSRSDSAARSRSLRRLEELGLVRREHSYGGPPDGRTGTVFLTQQGRETAEALWPETVNKNRPDPHSDIFVNQDRDPS